MLEKISENIDCKLLVVENDNIVVGVSGGPDSMALLDILYKLRNKYKLNLIVAHVNHQVRIESEEEEEFVRRYCKNRDIICEVKRLDVKNLSSNFHDFARAERYSFFKDVVTKYNANKIALAHHGDDQIETILMKIIRGSTLEGYSGIQSIRKFDNIDVIRPLLVVTKTEILTYCEINKVEYRLDMSNEKDVYTRNRIRKNILPFIKQENKDCHDKFNDFSETLFLASEYINNNVEDIFNELIESYDPIIFDIKKLNTLHEYIKRRLVIKAINKLSNNSIELSKRNVISVLEILSSDKPNISIDLPNNIIVKKEYNQLIFTYSDKNNIDYKVIINNNGKYSLPINKTIKLTSIDKDVIKNRNNFIGLCYNSVVWPLIVRPRKPGDKIKMAYGTKKIKNLFIDKKIPMSSRKTWPIITDGNDKILWIPGIAISKEVKNMQSSKDCILEVLEDA